MREEREGKRDERGRGKDGKGREGRGGVPEIQNKVVRMGPKHQFRMEFLWWGSLFRLVYLCEFLTKINFFPFLSFSLHTFFFSLLMISSFG
jgi:hypothetical protein